MGKTIKLRSTYVPTEKYRINELIGMLPKSEAKIGDIVEKLATYGVSQHDFYRDRKIDIKAKQSIPGDRLMVYAKFFDVTMEDLMNHNIKVKPVIKSRIKSPLK
jgi:hypothetical protein